VRALPALSAQTLVCGGGYDRRFRVSKARLQLPQSSGRRRGRARWVGRRRRWSVHNLRQRPGDRASMRAPESGQGLGCTGRRAATMAVW